MKKIGRYDIISELGRGAMGIVYRASDPTIGREVALKVLSISATPEEGTRSPQEMFMREVRAAGRLAHPSIVTIHDAFDDQENQTSCIVMELVPGVTLEKILDSDHPLTTEEMFSIIRQVAEGLDYAHRNQVIHRDLKPANIMVTEDGRAKITDFGIAKVLAREGVARTIGVMGTPSYMSPEQVRGGEVDARTDIFSLGIIIFTMLTGKKPFSGNTAAVMFKIVYEEPPIPSTLNPQLTPEQDYLVRKCLAKDANQRYSSARELLGDLDDLQHGRPLRSRAAAPGPAPSVLPAPAATPRVDRTQAMPSPGVIKPTPQQPSPPTLTSAPPQHMAAHPPKPVAPPPVVAPGEAGGPVTPPPSGRTLAMPIPGLMKGAPQPPRVVSAPPVPVQPPKPVIPPPVAPAPDRNARPLRGRTLPMEVPDLSGVTLPVPPSRPAVPPMPPVSDGPTLTKRTLPMPAPDLSGITLPVPPPRPAPPPMPPASHEPTLMERRLSMPAPDFPTASRSSGPRPAAVAPPLLPDDGLAVEPVETSGAALPAPKSKLIPVILGGVAVVLLAAGMWGYWRFHRIRTAPAPPPQVAVQTQEATPPPAPTPMESPTPPPAASVEETTPPVSTPPAVTKKIAAHKPKLANAPQPTAPEPAPPAAQPQPVPVTPSPNPSPPTPSPEDIAKAEAAKLANIPRIVQVLCDYGLKEATFTFAGGGQILFEETLKGKKKKGGFLGIKESYQGTFTHTITVPAGAPEVSIHVVAKDGALDLHKAIKMPPAGGFVPTLAVEVDNDHLSLNWQNHSAAK